MNRIIAIIGVVAAVLLLSPYLGINFFGDSAPSEESSAVTATSEAPQEPAAPPPAKEQTKRKQPRVEDILAHPSEDHGAASSQKLSDIERLLNHNGEDK
ncbi:MAG: hypothetical protein J0M12_15795 [Deltaproteobacteria bacterium]|nr:hypothetical protein [Deltaproteobacteria bacterium]